MESFLKYLEIVLVLLSGLCLVVDEFSLSVLWLLATSMTLEVSGVLAYIFINKVLR